MLTILSVDMTNKTDTIRSVERETQYLKETREYINNLKSDLIERILLLQQNKRPVLNPKDANTKGLNKFLLAAEEN